MEFIIAGMICFSKIDTNSMCLPFEQNPIVYHKTIEACVEDKEKLKVKLRKEFNKNGLLVDQLLIECLENPYKSTT